MANPIQRNSFGVNTFGRKVENFTHIVFDHDGTLVNTEQYPTQAFEGMSELLPELLRCGYKLYVWTARGRGSTVEILRSLAMIEHFDLLSCGSENSAKPSPEGIQAILPGIEPSKVIVIGDSAGDMMGGSAFGAYCIGALWGHGSGAHEQEMSRLEASRKIMSEHGANKSFISVNELKEFLLKLK
jgi:phosphoglycolate phosphatase-like HAD superfamily hydrolase